MKLAVLSDIHANPWALEAVMKMIDDVERIYLLGDVVGIGPHPRETLDILMRDKRVLGVMGNHDHNVLHGTELGPTENVPRRPHHDWVRSRLGDRHLEFLENPMLRQLRDGANITFMHRHPDDCGSKVPYFDEPFPHVLDSFYSDVPGDLLFFGHTHIPLDVIGASGRRYVNPGAVGAQNRGKAMFVILSTDDSPPSVRKLEAPYDVDAVTDELRNGEVPYWQFIIRQFF